VTIAWIGAPILHAAICGIRAGPASTAIRAALAEARRLLIPLEGGMNMTKALKKIALNKQTIRVLGSDELTRAAGGWLGRPITVSCPQALPSDSRPETLS
jgi:hypothetical protein